MSSLTLYLFVLFISFAASQPLLCSGRGYRDRFGLCRCQQAFHGANCEYSKHSHWFILLLFKDCLCLVHCPFGASWLSKPYENYQRNEENVPCSNMVRHCIHNLLILKHSSLFLQGSCDILTGKCTCRPGFEGRACQRSKF